MTPRKNTPTPHLVHINPIECPTFGYRKLSGSHMNIGTKPPLPP